MLDCTKEFLIESKLCPKICWYTEVDSTNNVARRFIEKENHIGFMVVAETQKAGKGQGERLWESPPGGLWSSLAICPELEPSLLGVVPILSAVGTAKAMETFGIKVMLKWPNDLLIKRNLKKIGGILVESKVSQQSVDYLIIGIGLNINNRMEQYSPTLQRRITTVHEEFKKELDLELLLQRIILEIEYSFENLRMYGTLSLLADWKKRDNILGMSIVVQSPEGKFQGKAVDISPYGQLILETPDFEKIVISNGTIILPKAKT